MSISEENSGSEVGFLAAGDQFADRFHIERVLGRGVSGIVYRAKDLEAGTTVALKLIPATVKNDSAAALRINQEMRVAFAVKSDYVINLYSCFTTKDYIAMVLEYVDGTSLFDFNEAGTILSIQEISNIGRQVAKGLEAIHSAGIVHRDLKLENIILDQDGMVKITDFGVAILESTFQESIEASQSSGIRAKRRATQKGTVVGTIHYLSPEYLLEQKSDARADIYAFGIVLYELVTTQFPYEYDSMKHLVYQKVNEDPVPPMELRIDCPEWLNDLILRAMARDPEKRFQSAREITNEFSSFMNQIPTDAVAYNLRRESGLTLQSPRPKKDNFKWLKKQWFNVLLLLAIIVLAGMNLNFIEMLYYQALTVLQQ
ncbi:MAG: serine/threonine protein kinase [Bdellovibrionales bacterium]|nr:serine/threonine protein kinase [Bdellovibrionales bacterium]